jgi:hypothetical protein
LFLSALHVFFFNEFAKSCRKFEFVIPLPARREAGIQDSELFLDPRPPMKTFEGRLRGGDGFGDFLQIHQFSCPINPD